MCITTIAFILSENLGSTLLIRRQKADASHSEREESLDVLLQQVMRNISGGSSFVDITASPVKANRIARWASISNRFLSPHKDPQVQIGRTLGLDHVPSLSELQYR